MDTRSRKRSSSQLEVAADNSDSGHMTKAQNVSGGKTKTAADEVVSQAKVSEEAKRAKRLLANRVSAQAARERRKEYVASIEAENTQLRKDLDSVNQQLATLRRLIWTMQTPQGNAAKHAPKSSDDEDNLVPMHNLDDCQLPGESRNPEDPGTDLDLST